MVKGLKVLVTRPAQQAQGLCDRIEQAGGQAIKFPVIEIKPVVAQEWLDIKLSAQSMLIFVSRNAATYFAAAWQGVLPEGIRMIAVGEGTATAMRTAGLRVDGQPEEESSEGLLSLLAKEEMAGENIWIVRGVGGRAHLASGLRAMGATVDYIEVYQRVLPVVSEAMRENALAAECAVVTSVAGLDNLLALLPSMQSRPLLVISERIAQHAVQCGFKQVIVSTGASDEAIVLALNKV